MSYSIARRKVAERPVLIGRTRVPRAEVAAAIGDVLPRVFRYAQEQGIPLTGRPFVRYIDAGPDVLTLEPGMPIAEPTGLGHERGGQKIDAVAAIDEEGLERGVLPGGFVATTLHVGSYDTLHLAYAALEQWIQARGLTVVGAPWESYLTDPTTVPHPEEWRTEVCWPVT